jgi:transcriptional regulator with XRE-family HTH domain
MAALGLVWAWPAEVTADPGRALAEMRRGVGLSQRAMARAIGVSQPTIIALETQFAGTLPRLRDYLRRLDQRELMRDPATPPRRLIPPTNAPGQDIVLTPQLLARRIVDAFADAMAGEVLDPCRGEGAFFDAFPPHLTAHWCELSEGRDFFGWTRRVDWVMTNPPFSKLRAFLNHAMAIGDNVVFLAALSHFGTRARIRDIRAAGFGLRRVLLVPTPRDWPSSGFQLAAVHLQRGWTRGCAFGQLRDIEPPEV